MALNVRGGQGIPPGPEKGNEKIKKQRAGFFLFQVWRINTGQVVLCRALLTQGLR